MTHSEQKENEKAIASFWVVSDLHVRLSDEETFNRNFKKMLEEVVNHSTDCLGIFAVGDLTDNGLPEQYDKLFETYASVEGLPPFFAAIGNHDFSNGSYEEKRDLFLRYVKLPNGEHPDSLHYDFVLGGYHFVFLGSDCSPAGGLKAVLYDSTIEWLDKTLAKEQNERKPVFVFLHQSLYNTVAGSLCGQGWNGVYQEEGLRRVLAKYPNVIMFNGHSHWTFDSECNMIMPSETLPAIVNTASVAYLWTSERVIGGEELAGSQGYLVSLYQDKVILRGRDFSRSEWIPSATYQLSYDKT